MPIKTTGAEFKRFYSDKEWWPKGRWHEGEDVKINGEDVDSTEADLGSVVDTDRLSISGGFVYDDNNDTDCGSLESYFRKWRKQQTNIFLSVECPKDRVDAVKAAITAAGGKVI